MTNAPVYYALAQAQFSPVAAMPKYVADIQDLLRRNGYALFEQQDVMQLQVGLDPAHQLPNPEPKMITSWLITKTDHTAGFILGPSSITYHTTHYETHNEFLPELMSGLEAVHKVVTLGHVSRLGLRYLDAVLPNKDERVEDYLANGLHGVFFKAKQRYALNEFVCETETSPLVKTSTLVARVYRMKSPLQFPPDLFPHGLHLMPRFQITEEVEHAVIDTDHFSIGTMPIDLGVIKAQLVSLHGKIKETFGAMTTTHAHDIWQ